MLLILLATYSLLLLLVSHITKFLNFQSLPVQALDLFTFPSTLIPLWVISSSLLTLNAIDILMIPEVQSQAWTPPLNPRFLYPLSYSISPLGCLVGISNVICPKPKSQSFSPNLSTHRISISKNNTILLLAQTQILRVIHDPSSFNSMSNSLANPFGSTFGIYSESDHFSSLFTLVYTPLICFAFLQ